MTREKLKPCPFCGGPATVTAYYWGYNTLWRVDCNGTEECGAAMQSFHDKAQATTIWNTRAALQRERDTLRRAALLALDFILHRQGNDAAETVVVADLRSATGVQERTAK